MPETLWFGIAVRNGVPAETLDVLNGAINKICSGTEMKEALD